MRKKVSVVQLRHCAGCLPALRSLSRPAVQGSPGGHKRRGSGRGFSRPVQDACAGYDQDALYTCLEV